MKSGKEDGRGASVLVINPGSTSTETGLFEASGRGRVRKIDHPEEALEAFEHVLDQVDWREVLIVLFIKDTYIFRTKIKAKILFFLLPLPFLLVIPWQLGLMFISF